MQKMEIPNANPIFVFMGNNSINLVNLNVVHYPAYLTLIFNKLEIYCSKVTLFYSI